MGDLSGRKRLSGGGKELVLGKGGLEKDNMHLHPGGGGAAGDWILF